MDPAVAARTAVVAYLIGSIPAAYLVGRLVGGVDVRKVGEGNAGARNVFHEVGPVPGLVVFCIDFCKGVAVALLFAAGPAWRLGFAAAFLVMGHAYPIWLGFVGGKGLASAGGFGVALMPWAAILGAAVAAVAWLASHRFLPTLVPAVVVWFAAAPFTGVGWAVIGTVLGGFLLVALKRVLDEPRMRRIEAETGWDRVRGGSHR